VVPGRLADHVARAAAVARRRAIRSWIAVTLTKGVRISYLGHAMKS
jgi:hypothetical protein